MDIFWGLSSIAWSAIYTLITFGLLMVAVMAALYAKGQWKASQQQIKDARRAQLEATRPYVIATVEPSAASAVLFDISVRNIERRPALDVVVGLDPPPKRAEETAGFEIGSCQVAVAGWFRVSSGWLVC